MVGWSWGCGRGTVTLMFSINVASLGSLKVNAVLWSLQLSGGDCVDLRACWQQKGGDLLPIIHPHEGSSVSATSLSVPLHSQCECHAVTVSVACQSTGRAG